MAIDSIAVTIQPNPDLATTDSTICNGDMVDIAGLVTDNATGTAGTISYHSSLADAQGNTNPMGSTTVNPSSTTKYYFRKETTSANCVDLDSVTITVQPNPDLTTTDATICAGTGIDLSGQVTDASNTSGTTTFHSTLADAQSGNGSLSNGVTPTSTTKYYVRKVTTTANCVDVDSLTITIEPVPALITVDSTVCANTDIDLASLVADDVTVAGTTTFHNSLMDAQTGSNALGSSTVNSATTTKYYVRKITNTASCIDVDSMTITRQPLPDLVTEDSTICATQAVDLAGLVTDNAGTTGTVTFHTSNTDAQLGMNALGNSNVSPSSNTTYFVRKVTTVGGCYSTASLTIMVQPNPDLSTTDATICNGASIDLSGQVTDNASTTGTMSFHTSLADAQNSANPISPTTVNPSATTKYYVQKTTTTANCQDIDSLTITVQPLPDLMTTNDTICAMESIALTGLVSDNAATVGTISFHNSLTDAQNGANALGSTNVSPVNTTKYFVRKSTTTASCVDVDSLEITVQPLPDLMTNNDTLCAGQSVDIATLVTDNAGTTGTMTYHTSLADAQSGTNPMGSTTVSPANTTTYFVRKITTINNCLDIDSLTVQIEPVPNLTTQDSAICAGTTIDIAPLATDAAGLTGSITFHNNLADAQGGTNPMGSTSVTPASTTKYYVSKAVGTQNCRDIDSLTVTVNPLPANATNPRDTSYCNGGTVPPLRVDDPSAGFTVTWWTAATGGSQVTGATMGGSRNEAITLSGTSSPAAPVVGNTTTIYAEIVNTTTMCVSASRVAVNLTNHEEPSITSITPMGCSGDTTMLAATVVNGALPYGYTWSIVGSAITPFAGGTATSTDAMPEFDASSVAPGTYMIQLALQDANNCVDTSTFNFVVQAGPDATFTTVDNMVCAGDTAVVYAVENQGVGASYSWTFSNASLVRGGTATDTFLVVNWDQGGTSGTVNVTVTLASGCSGQNTTNVTISPKPTLAATSNSPICAGDTLQLNATASGGTPNYNYNWSGPNSFSANVEDPFIANTTLAAAGTYLVTVTDVNGCSDSTNTVVTIEQVPDLTTRDTTVCPDATVDLATLVTDENGTTGTTTFYHNLADAESNTNAIGSTIDTSLTTRYYVRKSITNVPNCTDIDSILVTIQPNPDLVTTNTLICANETVDLSTLVTDNNGTTGTLAYYATLANAQSGTSPISANQILTDTTTFYITKTTATASCTDLDSVTVNVQALPDLATTDSTICAATTIDLVGLVTDNANTAGTMTFHTNLADANSGSSSIASSVTPTVITKYYVRKATTMGMCVAVDSTTITVQTNPDLVTTDTTICAGQSTDLTTRVVDNAGTVGTVSFYQSRTDAVANTGALGSPSVTPNFSTQYFVRKATTTADCVELDSFMVMIQPLPDLVATTALICAGQSVNLATLVTDNASTTGTISYHNTLSDAQTNVNPIANTQSPTANATYYAAKRTTNANCLDVVEITVNVQALPDLATTDSTICAGIAVDLNGLVTDNASTTGTVSFHTTHADATNGTGGIASSVSPTSTTDYYVRKITTGSNCVDTDSLTITVQPNPDLVTTDSLICAGTTIDLSGLVTDNAGTTGTLSYHTTVADAQANTSPIGSSVTPTATRRYYFRKATTTGNCTAIDSTLITVQMLPNLVTQPDTICAGTGIDLTTLVTDNAGTTGTLSFHNSLVDAQANANPITNNQTPISNQKYYVLKTTTMGNCTDVDSIEIVVQPLPNLGARDTTICEGESVDISVLVTDTANTTGATTFHSNLADANSGTNSLATTVNPAITTRYYVRKVTTTKGCPDVDSLTVNVTTLPDLATRDTSICTNESVDLALLFTDNANTVGTTTYYNSLADANIATNAIGSSVTPTSTDTFYLRKAVSSSSCFAVDSIVVTLLPLPDLSTTPTTICPSESVDLSTLVAHNAGTAGTTTYHNSLADALSNSNNIGPNQNPSTTTKYYIRKSTTNNCLDYDSVMVNVQPLPDLVTTPGAVCPGGNVDLTTLVTDNTGAAGTLTAHANLADAQNGTSVIANTVSPTTQTTYYLRKVTTTASCVAVDSVTVSILPEANIQGRDTSICAGMSLDLKRLLSGTVSGSLKYGTSFGNYPDTISTLITAAATQTYFIENEIGGGCTDTTMIRVTTLACDLGDLPDTSATFNASDYQTLLANNGPIHVIIPGLSLGVTVDGETDGQPSNDALGDGDDEDGLTIFPSLDLKPGVPFKLPLSVSNTTGDTAYVEAWIDWNGDGDFDDPNEMVANFKDATDGNFPNSINGTVPTNATTGRLLGVRIRVSNTDNMTPYGYQNSGEIEDYLIGIDCPSIICVPVSYEINRE
ncbi:MAG: GEVED domain-containing protein [Bacteroidota bacterium]